MTGLFNRRHFGEQLSKEIDRWKRHGHPFSYIITDLDYLKKINDTLGHQFGDLAIKHIASVVRNNIRDVDTAPPAMVGKILLSYCRLPILPAPAWWQNVFVLPFVKNQ